MHCEYYDNSTFSNSSVDLAAALGEHISLMNDMYALIYEKLAKTIYKSNKEKYAKLIDELSDGKVMRDGGIAIRSADGYRVLVTTFTEA